MKKDFELSWHYPRTRLAQAYLMTLESGAPTMAIFAERRKGKTEFLTDDMTPLAESKGHRCCYVNFWEDRTNPVACIVNGVNRSLKSELVGVLRGWKKEISVNLGALQAKITKDADASIQTANAALQCLLEPDGTILLQCDEIQHLATSPEFEDVTASLRTWIDSNKKRVRTIFTGSSQDNLNRLFRNQRAAFYNSASIVPFPDMTIEFAEFLSRRFHYLTGRSLPAELIMPVFIENHSSPAFIVELLQVMVRDGYYDLDTGLAYYYKLHPRNEDNLQIWNALSLIDRKILVKLAKPEAGSLYTRESYDSLSKEIGVKVSKSSIQNSLNRMREAGLLINQGRGVWEFENSGFKSFVAGAEGF
ncbi:MAG: hypothetical protein CSB48_00940 [Proteobacteria bacterium]|nr:MAG: hypothetical protein CSB48_00940 [Pseudomonadota bacterium]PIE40339.1 MAG: hypothetical protein CSA51_01240 [Gammaproteobacteria bacterium]